MFAFPDGYLETLFGFLTTPRAHSAWDATREETIELFGPLATLTPGLSLAELGAVEGEFEFRFPPDLRVLLSAALPTGRDWPDWRHGERQELRRRLAWPVNGILFDIEHAGLWLPNDWGPRPPAVSEAVAVAREAMKRTPNMVPVWAHRYIPGGPSEPGNPVFSVWQSDIIIYGWDIAEYFHREFGAPLPEWAANSARIIEFWSDLVLRRAEDRR